VKKKPELFFETREPEYGPLLITGYQITMKSILLTLTILLLTLSAPVQAQDEENPKAEIPLALQQDLTIDHTVAELQLLVAPLTVAQLVTEAEEWQSYVQSSMSRIAHLKVAAMNTEGAELDRLHEQINEASEARTELVGKFLMIVESMEAKGGDPELVALYRNYVTGAVASEFQATDMKTILSQVINWVISAEGGVGFLLSAATIIGSLFVLIIVARFIRALA
jgi:small conductance mechanosensitive channel